MIQLTNGRVNPIIDLNVLLGHRNHRIQNLRSLGGNFFFLFQYTSYFFPSNLLFAYGTHSGLQDGTILIWDLLTNHCQFLRGHSCMVWDVNFSLDGRFLASIDQQGQFIIWTTEVNSY